MLGVYWGLYYIIEILRCLKYPSSKSWLSSPPLYRGTLILIYRLNLLVKRWGLEDGGKVLQSVFRISKKCRITYQVKHPRNTDREGSGIFFCHRMWCLCSVSWNEKDGVEERRGDEWAQA